VRGRERETRAFSSENFPARFFSPLSFPPPFPLASLALTSLARSRAPPLSASFPSAPPPPQKKKNANPKNSLSFQPDATGRVSLSFIRHGRPVPGLGPGSLLAASPDLDRAGGVFARAVVLVTEHGGGRRGTRGVILSRPLGELDEEDEEGGGGGGGGTRLGGALSFFGVGGGGGGRRPATGATLRHFLGGPVGMPGDGPGPEVAVLHGVPDVPGARRLLPRGLTSKRGRGGALGGGDADAPPDPRSLLFEGGGLVDVVRAAARSAAKGRGGRGGGGGGIASGSDDPSSSAADAAAASASRASSLAAVLAASAARAAVPPFVESSSYPPEGPSRRKGRPSSALSRGAAAASSSSPASSAAGAGRWKRMLEAIDPAAVPPRIVERKDSGKKTTKEAEAEAAAAAAAAAGRKDGTGDDGLLARLAKRRRRALFPPSSSSASARSFSSRKQPRTVVHVYHGAAAWSAGQLEGELRAGAWGLVPAATAADVLDGSPEDLWRSLVSSGRLTWLARR